MILQGVDGLAAPLVVLYFTEEAVAFACLDAVVQRLLPGLFDTDASQVPRVHSCFVYPCDA